MDLDAFLRPFPRIYRFGPKRWQPWIAGGIVLGGLYGAIQVVRLATGNPWKGTTLVYNAGDPALAVLAWSISAALQSSDLESKRSMESYLKVGGLFLTLNTVGEVFNLLNGMALSKELEPGQLAHFLLTPVWGALLAVPGWDVLFHLKGKEKERLLVAVIVAFYLYTLYVSMSQGSLA